MLSWNVTKLQTLGVGMHLLNDYQLFLFDFDGLLVNTEEIHFLAYQQMCAHFGIHLDWSFSRYCQAAHYDAHALRDQIYALYPDLKQRYPNWDVLYAEKRKRVISLLKEGRAELMPGVKELLELLAKKDAKRCVVTHSPEELVSVIRKQYPLLNSIPHWITRNDYKLPKPHPESYLTAIQKFAGANDRIIGFEDTPRGIKALMQTKAQPVLICQAAYPEIPTFISEGVLHYPSLAQLSQLQDYHF